MSTLQSVSANSEIISLSHFQDNRDILQTNRVLRASTDNGWTKDRTMQWVGRIPALEYVKLCKIDPGMKDPKALVKFLDSTAGAAYRIAENKPHKCANIIIK